jgi:hypothetical protein
LSWHETFKKCVPHRHFRCQVAHMSRA